MHNSMKMLLCLPLRSYIHLYLTNKQSPSAIHNNDSVGGLSYVQFNFDEKRRIVHAEYQATANIYTHLHDETLRKAYVNLEQVFSGEQAE